MPGRNVSMNLAARTSAQDKDILLAAEKSSNKNKATVFGETRGL